MGGCEPLRSHGMSVSALEPELSSTLTSWLVGVLALVPTVTVTRSWRSPAFTTVMFIGGRGSQGAASGVAPASSGPRPTSSPASTTALTASSPYQSRGAHARCPPPAYGNMTVTGPAPDRPPVLNVVRGPVAAAA